MGIRRPDGLPKVHINERVAHVQASGSRPTDGLHYPDAGQGIVMLI